MTPELAIQILSGDTLGTASQTNEAVKMAIEALEDKIPRKIKKETTDVRTYYCVSCPKCNKHFGYQRKYNIWMGEEPLYCNCGQRLDWSDIDDNIPT